MQLKPRTEKTQNLKKQNFKTLKTWNDLKILKLNFRTLQDLETKKEKTK